MIKKTSTPNKYNGPQVDYIDKNGVQWIELNRGCKRGCEFCHADTNYKEFPIPKIRSNKVQIIGEGFCFDSRLDELVNILSKIKVNNRVVYYGFSQGMDARILIKKPNLIKRMAKARFGIINNKGRWYKGFRFAWDWGQEQEKTTENFINMLDEAGYRRKHIQVFMLANWKISPQIFWYKLDKLWEYGVKVDDCTWECTKRNFIPLYWDRETYKATRWLCRKHNQMILFDGYNPENHKEVYIYEG